MVKRTFDVAVAAVALVLLSPVLVVIFLAVRLSSRGPGFFRQSRIGAGGTQFRMVKFRTMRMDCDDRAHREYVTRLLEGTAEPSGGLYKLEADERITPVGAFLRRTSLDELPQLFNVLRGQMSLVGPRPAIPWEVEMFPGWAFDRFSVRPGVTGLWQVSGRNRLTMLEGLELDVAYVARRTFWFDALILLRTVPAVLGGGAR